MNKIKKKLTILLILLSVSTRLTIAEELHELTEGEKREITEAMDNLILVDIYEFGILWSSPVKDTKWIPNESKPETIEDVVAHLIRYYTPEIVEDYLYYLKTCTNCKFYNKTGVFATDSTTYTLDPIFNSATDYSIEYEIIEIQKVESNKYVVSVRTSITYYGTFTISDPTNGEYVTNSYVTKNITKLYLAKDGENRYYFYSLSDAAKERMKEH